MKEKFTTVCTIKLTGKQTYYMELIKHKDFYVLRILDKEKEPRLVTKAKNFQEIESKIIKHVSAII